MDLRINTAPFSLFPARSDVASAALTIAPTGKVTMSPWMTWMSVSLQVVDCKTAAGAEGSCLGGILKVLNFVRTAS
jgi:hypothetical protein